MKPRATTSYETTGYALAVQPATSPSHILKELAKQATLVKRAAINPDSPSFVKRMQELALDSEQKQSDVLPGKTTEPSSALPSRQEKHANHIKQASVAKFSRFYAQGSGSTEPQLWKKAVKSAVKEDDKEKDKARAKERQGKASRHSNF